MMQPACVCAQSLSCVWFFGTPWTEACQAPMSMELPQQEYWNGVPFPSPGDFHDPGIEPKTLVSPALAGRFFTTAPPGKSHLMQNLISLIQLSSCLGCPIWFSSLRTEGVIFDFVICLFFFFLSWLSSTCGLCLMSRSFKQRHSLEWLGVNSLWLSGLSVS